MQRENVIKAVVYLLGSLATAVAIAFGLSSCKALRTITTKTEVVHKADTTIVNTDIKEIYTSKKLN